MYNENGRYGFVCYGYDCIPIIGTSLVKFVNVNERKDYLTNFFEYKKYLYNEGFRCVSWEKNDY